MQLLSSTQRSGFKVAQYFVPVVIRAFSTRVSVYIIMLSVLPNSLHLEQGHLRWDSLGEYLALAVSFEHLAETTKNARAEKLGRALNKAIERLLENRKSPGRKVNQLDNRASNFYIALYWAEYMAAEDPAYQPLSDALKAARSQVVAELKTCQGKPTDVGGYYKLDDAKAGAAMRPSPTFNKIMESA